MHLVSLNCFEKNHRALFKLHDAMYSQRTEVKKYKLKKYKLDQ